MKNFKVKWFKLFICQTILDYKGYTWIELASPLAVDYIPSKTDMLKPAEGHLVVKVIKKCQVIVFEETIYQLNDGKGNLYVMHATENGTPNLNVVLPVGFTLQKVAVKEPLVVIPFGEKVDCSPQSESLEEGSDALAILIHIICDY